jgi:hypothetical protein
MTTSQLDENNFFPPPRQGFAMTGIRPPSPHPLCLSPAGVPMMWPELPFSRAFPTGVAADKHLHRTGEKLTLTGHEPAAHHRRRMRISSFDQTRRAGL